MSDKMVKGTMLLDYVKMIRANKDKPWDKYVKPEDWELINSLVLPTKWYPLDIYKRLGQAAYHVLAEDKLDRVRLSGQFSGKQLFGNVYKSMVASQDPARGLNQFVATYGSLFNFSTLKFEKAGDKHVRIHHDYDASDKGNIPYCHQLMGMFDSLVELNGGKNCKIELSAKQWEGASASVFEITWE